MVYNYNNDILKEQKAMQAEIAKEQRNLQNNIAKDQRILQKDLAKSLKFSISKEGRVRIPAKRRHEVEDKYHNKCAVCKLKPCKLQIHHKNMKNNDNCLSNLELLCPNHHIQRHSKMFRRKYHTQTLMGSRVTSRLVKKGKKKIRRQNSLGYPQFKLQKLNIKGLGKF